MTPELKARELYERVSWSQVGGHEETVGQGLISKAIHEAIAAEREACAKEAIFHRHLAAGVTEEEKELVARVCQTIQNNIRARK